MRSLIICTLSQL